MPQLTKVIDDMRRELRHLRWGGETLEQTPQVTRRLSSDGLSCEVVAFDLDADSADEVIRQERDLAKRRGMSLEWKAFSFDSPSDLPYRLRSAEFEVGEKESLVVYDLSDGLGALAEVRTDDVRRMTRQDQLEDYREVSEAAFGRDASRWVGLLAEALDLGGTDVRGYIAYEEGRPCAVGRLYTNPASLFGGLYGGGTAPEFRSRGHYRALVAARARDALESGVAYLLSDALPTSLPILLKLGFVHVADTWPCTLP